MQRRPSAAAAALMQQRIFAERRWTLGMQTRKPIGKVVNAIYAALTEMNASWKKLAPYAIKARYEMPRQRMDEDPAADVSNVVKIEIQIFKLRDHVWQIDLQKVAGGIFQFLDLSNMLCTGIAACLEGPLPK